MNLIIEKNSSISKKSLRETCNTNFNWRFLMTGVQLPDTSLDQAHMQLSRSYINAYHDSSSNGILWNIETIFWKSSPWEFLEERKGNTRCSVRKTQSGKTFSYFDGVRVSTFSFWGKFFCGDVGLRFLRWRFCRLEIG